VLTEVQVLIVTHLPFGHHAALQDYLICIEMFVASIAFTYAFTHRDYQSAAKSKVRVAACRLLFVVCWDGVLPTDVLVVLKVAPS